MRLYLLLILLAVSMAFSAGYLFLSQRYVLADAASGANDDAGQIAALERRFFETNHPKFSFSPSTVSSLELIDPQNLLPQTQKFPLEELRPIYHFAETCRSPQRVSLRSAGLRKAWNWHRHLCGQGSRISERFFRVEPLIHPAGTSYALLYLQTTGSEQWAKEHLALFHVSELTFLTGFHITLPAELALLSQLDSGALKALLAAEPFVFSENTVLIRSSGDNFQTASYDAFSRNDFEQFYARSLYSVNRAQEGQHCIMQEGEACFRQNVDRLVKLIHRPSTLLLWGSVLISFMTAWILVRRLRLEKALDDRRRFAFQTLTHELRTPISSLLVSVENMRSSLDAAHSQVPSQVALQIPSLDDLQGTLVQVCDDVNRLRRLAETSKQYLTTETGEKLIELKHRKITSINEFVQAVSDPYREKVRVYLLPQDESFYLDPYWAALSLKNLIENALAHGKPPVQVFLELTLREPRDLKITVQDAGSCSFTELKRMTRPFARGKASQGMGLGLAIVQNVVREMRGSLEFSPGPTRFTLRISENAGEQQV